MTAVAVRLAGPAPSRTSRLIRQLSNVAVLTGRNLVHIAREPLQLSDVTIQPVLFTALFVYVFGSGVILPRGGTYASFAIAGMLALNLTTSSMGTAVGLSNDLNGGIIDRFSSLPMWRPAVLVGRSVTDPLTAGLCTFFVLITGLLVGWRPEGSAAGTAGGIAIFLLFSYALSWGCACLGIVSKGPESAQGVGLVILFPLAVVSNALVPTARMPAVLRAVEPGERRDGSLPSSLRQPEPVGGGARLAYATPRRHDALVVHRDDRGVRPPGGPPVRPSDSRLSRRPNSS
jgi:hypothetical protein